MEEKLNDSLPERKPSKMIRTTATDENVAAIPDADLIEQSRKWLSKLCKSGGKDWRLCVPAQTDDPDVLLDELANRYEKAVKEIEELRAVIESLTKNKE